LKLLRVGWVVTFAFLNVGLMQLQTQNSILKDVVLSNWQ